MQRRRAVHAAGLGVVAALALSGCGSAPDDAGQAWQQARTQLDQARSVRLTTATTDGSQGPHVVTWDVAGALDGSNETGEAAMEVGEDSWMQVHTRSVDGTSYARVDTRGEDVPAQVAQGYVTDGWRKTQAQPAGQIRATLDAIGLPAADALQGADVQPEEVEYSGGTAHRYVVPPEVADAARGDKSFSLRAFTVDEDGDLVGLRVEDDSVVQEFQLSEWDEIEPAQAPEEVQQ